MSGSEDTIQATSVTGDAWAASLFARDTPPPPTSAQPDITGGSTSTGELPAAAASGAGLGHSAKPRPVATQPEHVSAMTGPITDTPGHDVPQYGRQAKVWAGALVGITVLATVAASVIMVATSRDDPAPKRAQVPALAVGAPTVEPTTPAEDEDALIPYMASGDPQETGCYDGSSSPGALQETDTESAWVCVRGFGGAGGGTNGQKLSMKLGNEQTGPRWYMVSKIKITSGWVPKVQGGRDDWSKHRVPTRVRFVFNDSSDPSRPPSHWDVDTHGARGPVSVTGPRPVLASEITMVILETQRPAADDPATTDSASPTTTTPLYPELTPTETPTEDPQNPAAVDATFAISLLQIEGKAP